jgi:UDP-N-acetylmuramate dehydrogenase
MERLLKLEQQLNQLGIPVRTDVPLAPYTTFHIGGPASLLIEPTDERELIAAVRAVQESGVFSLMLGRGSNVLLPDEGIMGAVIRTASVKALCVQGTSIIASCGDTLHDIACAAQEAGLTGVAFAYGIPGTLGGALFMNAGAYGGQMADIVSTVRVYDTEQDRFMTLDSEQMDFSYRHSALQAHPEWLVLGATLCLTHGDSATIKSQMREYMQRRRDKQPLEFPSAGSTFKRPEGAFAGQLIEQSGLKGCRIGGAMVSTKHAGFIVNAGGATARDVLALIEHVRSVVQRDHGIELESEVQILTSHMAK